MQSSQFPQTFVGAITVAVLAGSILLFVQRDFFQPGPVPPSPLPPGLVPSGLVTPRPVTPIPEIVAETFVAPIGVTKVQIAQCVQRNSSPFVLGRDYSLEENGLLGEVLVKLHERDQTLKVLLQGCSTLRAN
jgi:hypothetical protein